MTDLNVNTRIALSQHSAGWATIASGVIGIVAFVFLLVGVIDRGQRTDGGPGALPIGARTIHDFGIMLQALLMIPAARVLNGLGGRRAPRVSRAACAVGIAALSLIAILQMLLLVDLVPDRLETLYMPPLGVIGMWLIVVNSLVSGVIPRGLTRIGTVAGLGLAVMGMSAALFLTLQALGGAAAVADPRIVKWNQELHIGLAVGSFLGRTTFPIWAVLLGRRLLQLKHAV